MATTMTLIGSATATSGAVSSLSFSSIPQTYTDLWLKTSLIGAGGANWALISLNGTSDSTADMRHIIGDAATVASQAYSSVRVAVNRESDFGTSTFGLGDFYIHNYTNASSNKAMNVESAQISNATSRPSMNIVIQRWNNNSAVTSITLTVDGGVNFLQHSTAYLYGIKNS